MSPSQPDNPFGQGDAGGDDRTFIMPQPGRRRATAPLAGSAAAPMARAPQQPEVAADVPPPDTGLNPLVALANPLLCTAPRLRLTSHVSDPQGLKDELVQAVRTFEQRARAQGLAPERVQAARYILCTVLDEAAACTPWGAEGVWGHNNLLVTFHNESFGGDKVFQLMTRLAEDPQANRDLLELIYAAINLGFEGRYRIVDGGRVQLEAIRDRLAGILQTVRGDHAPALAQHWQVPPHQARPWLNWLPLWVSAAVAAGVLLALYLGFAFGLGQVSDTTYTRIMALQPPALGTERPQPVAAPAPARLAPALQAEVQAGWLTVRDELDRSLVALNGQGLFDSGSATLTPERAALIGRIGAALARLPGKVLVTGHTDNVQSRSVRFPSNWHLSQARAEAVQAVLQAAGVSADRLKAEGRGESMPVVPNDSDEHRARNRRVEIELRVPPPSAPAGA